MFQLMKKKFIHNMYNKEDVYDFFQAEKLITVIKRAENGGGGKRNNLLLI